MSSKSTMSLTDELVSLSLRHEEATGPDADRMPLSEQEAEAFAEQLLGQSEGAPLWVFAYGSLIWKPDFDAVESRHVRGWHRSVCDDELARNAETTGSYVGARPRRPLQRHCLQAFG
jgi:cation transport protein ChaC